jgi:hypothetical protein
MNTTVDESLHAFELATRIAPHLSAEAGYVWHPSRGAVHEDEDNPICAYLVGPGAARLVLHAGGGWCAKGRVAVSGCWPKFADGRIYTPRADERLEITCDARRDAKVIAKEIARRLLPVYEASLRRAVDYVERDDAAKARAEEAAHRIAAALGGDAHAKRSHDGSSSVWPMLDGLPNIIRVQPNYDRGPLITFDFEADEKTALAVLALLREGRQ